MSVMGKPDRRLVWLVVAGAAGVLALAVAILAAPWWMPLLPSSSPTAPAVAQPSPGASSSPIPGPSPTEFLGGVGGPDGDVDKNLAIHNPIVEFTTCADPASADPYFSLSGYDPSRFSVAGALPYESAIGRVHVLVDWLNLPAGASVHYETVNGSAIAGQDFDPTSGTLTFAGGATSLSFSIAVRDDDVAEPAESFIIVLSSPNPANVQLFNCRMKFWIWDDDGPTVTFEPMAALEGLGTYEWQLIARLSPQTYREVVVTVHCQDDSAVQWLPHFGDTAGYDYRCPQEILILFPALSDTATFTVEIIGDAVAEGIESFRLHALDNISSTGGFSPVDIVSVRAGEDGVATIIDDDGPPSSPGATATPGSTPPTFTFDPGPNPTGVTFTFPPTDSELSIGDGSDPEGDGFVSVPLTLSMPIPYDLPVDFGVIDGSALVNVDHLGRDGTVTIPAGQTFQEIQIPTLDDQLDEADESLFVIIAAPAVTITNDTAIGTILDDDASPGIVVDQPTAVEGEGKVRFVVALTAASGRAVSVTFRTANGTASAPADYTAMGVSNTIPCPVPPSASTAYPCVLRFEPGETAIAIDVPIVNDATAETSETVLVRLSDPINASVDVAQGTGTIRDNDFVVVQESSTAIAYVKTWRTQTLALASGGSVRYASVSGSTARLTFTGRRIEVLGTRGLNRGKVAILLDGVKVATVNLYSATVQPAAVVYTRDFATSGQHTIQLKVLGTKDSRSTGTRVDLDAFRYLR